MKSYLLRIFLGGIILIGLLYFGYTKLNKPLEVNNSSTIEIAILQDLGQEPILVNVYVRHSDKDKSIINEYTITEPETKIAFKAMEETSVYYVLSGTVGATSIRDYPILIVPGQDKYIQLFLEKLNEEYIFRK